MVRSIAQTEGALALYKGLLPSLAGIAPYIAINFCTFDVLKATLPDELRAHPAGSFLTAFAATTLATTCCYPLDTLRRQMQVRVRVRVRVFV